jgi:hypothetical protein
MSLLLGWRGYANRPSGSRKHEEFLICGGNVCEEGLRSIEIVFLMSLEPSVVMIIFPNIRKGQMSDK